MQKKSHTRFIQEALAELYEMTGDNENAVLTYLDTSISNVENCPMFQWIEDHHLIHLIMNRAFDLFRLNSKQAASLLCFIYRHAPINLRRHCNKACDFLESYSCYHH